MEVEKKLILERLAQLIKNGTLSASCINPYKYGEKRDAYSEKFRKDGNNLYLNKNHDSHMHEEVLRLYNQSIAHAPNNSEALATAYGNKSALLRHVSKYAECVSEIDKALQITESNVLKIKLLCRKAECLTALNSSDNQKNLDKAKFISTKLKESEDTQSLLANIISKTESILLERNVDQPRQDKKHKQLVKSIEKAEKLVASNSVEVKYSEKYGYHLIAARDFKPGEFITAEKPYCSVANPTYNHSYLYCGNCTRYLWNCIPCDHCTWCLFCSEQCKNQAWKEYHDIECNVITGSLAAGGFRPFVIPQITLRTMLKAIRQAGSIKKLKSDIENLSYSKDYGSFPKNGEFGDYKKFYSLKSGAAPEEIEKYSRVFTLLLLMIVKHSLILGRKYDVQELRKLMKIEDFITIGALLMKTYKVVCLNCQLVATTTNDLCEFKNRTERCADSCCQMKAHAVLTRALIPLSCCPNISQFIINENHAISFTLSPIKKGEQLFTSIYSVYRFAPKLERQRVFRKRFHCYCECDMCINNWTERDLTSEENEESCAHTEKFKLKMLLAQANLAMNARSHDIELVSQVKEQVEKAWKYFKLPSKTLIEAVTTLIQCIQLVYFETGNMPGECSY